MPSVKRIGKIAQVVKDTYSVMTCAAGLNAVKEYYEKRLDQQNDFNAQDMYKLNMVIFDTLRGTSLSAGLARSNNVVYKILNKYNEIYKIISEEDDLDIDFNDEDFHWIKK